MLEKYESDYLAILKEIKDKINNARLKSALHVNNELLFLYWEIGKTILEKQSIAGWGAKIIDLLSRDLQESYSKDKGYSVRNLKYMRKFAETYPDFSIVQQPVAQIPWGHNTVLMEKIKDFNERLWYAQKAIEYGWSRDIMIHHIELKLYERQVLTEKVSNFATTLPKPESDLAHNMLKDPYKFNFLTIDEEARELEVEKELVKHITNFLLELGAGFSFVGRQYHLEVDGEDFYIDLLFYHLKLRCYFVIELKAGKYKPEFAGKLNFYLAVVDDKLKHPSDNPSIGLILCKNKNKVIAEYSLQAINRPIGISEYQIVKSIPDEIKIDLPSIEELEKELSDPDEKI